jgi:hypothetical protein
MAKYAGSVVAVKGAEVELCAHATDISIKKVISFMVLLELAGNQALIYADTLG